MAPENNPDDHILMGRIARRDREAFLQLYDRYASKVYALSLHMMGEVMAAEEVTQDAFLKLWTRANSFSIQKGTLLAWLLTITRRTALDRIRRENRRPDFNNPTDPETTWKITPDPTSQSEEQRWRSLHFALQELPQDQRISIELAHFHGLSQSQIAEHLDLPLGTIKTRLRLGMEKLRQIWIGDTSKSA